MPQDVIVDGQKVNEVTGHTPKNRSRFPLGRPNFGTYRFGEYGVTEALEVVPDDSIDIRPNQSIQTYTLGAPLMQDINLKQDAFFVAMQSILPWNWDKFFVNPVKGEDVPDDVNTVVENFDNLLRMRVAGFVQECLDAPDDVTRMTYELRLLIFMEMFYSEGSLISSLGAHFGDRFEFYAQPLDEDGNPISTYHKHDFGRFFDMCMHHFISQFTSINVQIDGVNYVVTKEPNSTSSDTIGFRDFLCMIRDTFNWNVFNYTPVTQGATYQSILSQYPFENLTTGWEVSGNNQSPFNFARLAAYQLACAHFFTNDHVDYIYSAELYRQLIGDIVNNRASIQYFQVNGLTYQYDYLSGRYLEVMLNVTSISDNQSLDYFRMLFGYNYSLRFLDYFTGSRTQPLAVGDVDVAVNNNMVSVIDITQNIMKQKFLNSVNRIGNRIENYTKELFGVEMGADYHNPLWLYHTNTPIKASQTENTGDAQMDLANSVTSRLFGASGNKSFHFAADRAGIVIMINYFDLSRLYCRSIERQFFHKDRFDMFNPYLQYVGDQVIYADELRANASHSNVFGYQGRYMEYKQRYPVCFGAFRYNLPGFAFVDDYNNARDKQTNISPSYIRSIPTELDRFYLKLTGYSLDSYFHFIIKNMNDVSAVRPMAYNPGILNS